MNQPDADLRGRCGWQEWERELKEYGTTRRLKSQLTGTGRSGAARSLANLARQDSMVDL